MRELTKEEMRLVVGGSVELAGGGGSHHNGNIQPIFEKQISKNTTIKLGGNINYNHGKVKLNEKTLTIQRKF